jgi:hypothetical protein
MAKLLHDELQRIEALPRIKGKGNDYKKSITKNKAIVDEYIRVHPELTDTMKKRLADAVIIASANSYNIFIGALPSMANSLKQTLDNWNKDPLPRHMVSMPGESGCCVIFGLMYYLGHSIDYLQYLDKARPHIRAAAI